MSLFKKLFYGLSPVELELQEMYVPMLQMMGMPATEAKHTFEEMIKRAKAESEHEGTGNLPADFGDLLLKREPEDVNVQDMLDKKRREGVTDDDIRWWWNMHDIERRIMLQFDEISRFALYSKHLEAGLSRDEASREVRKIFPFFGDPNDTQHASGEHRPLPCELKDRINTYIQRRTQTDRSSFQAELRVYSSCNALLRSEMSKGRL